MEEYRFEHKEPLTQRVVLALRVNTKQLKEQLWLGTEYEAEAALRGLDKPLYLSQTRHWERFGTSSEKAPPMAGRRLCGPFVGHYRRERQNEKHKSRKR